MKTILLSIIMTFFVSMSYLFIEPIGSIYLQSKTIDVLNKVDSLTKQNNQLKSRIAFIQRQYGSL